MDIQIILPDRSDEPLSDLLLEITKAIYARDPGSISHGLLGGEFGYGGVWDSPVFLMHPHCWCKREGECPWCTGCGIYQYRNQCSICANPNTSLEQRRAADCAERCDYVAGRGIFGRFAPWTLDDKSGYYDPPNFWHKPTNFRVTWYKYIGRSLVSRNMPTDLSLILAECLADISRNA